MRMKKILVTLIAAIFVVAIAYSTVYSVLADDAGNFDLSVHESGKTVAEAQTAVETLTGTILAVFRYAGAGIAVISLVVIGAKYLYGSPGEKADYKKNLLVYTVGGIGMFSVGTILKIIRDLSDKIESGS
jgi:hypothetical protein